MKNEGTRRLSAIMATDIVGYSAMLERDEARTLAGLREFRTNLLEPTVLSHDGKTVKNMGDGWLVEFASTTNAVNCAAEIQEALVDHEMIKLRIGIHIGDIVHEDDDIFGEGVNVAARLEQLAEPGAVLISDVVHRFIDQKTLHAFTNLGNHQLKNISREQLIFGWAPEAAKCVSLIAQAAKKTDNQKDFAQILLFEAFRISGSKEEAADVAEELQYELMAVLSRRAGLKVVSERKDGVSLNHVLGGRIRVSGENLRIDITISDDASGASIWVERFTGAIDEVDNLITDVRNKVSIFLRNMTNALSGTRYSDTPDSDLSLSELLSKSAYLIQRWDRHSVISARESLELVVKQAPENPMALAMLATTFVVPVYSGYGSNDDLETQRAIELANKAVSIDPNIDFLFQGRALIKCILLRDLDGAKKDCERALKINPYYHAPRYTAAIIDVFNGHPDIGIKQLSEYIRTISDNPNAPFANSMNALGHMICGENDKALQFAREAYELKPSLPIFAAVYAAAVSNKPEIINSDNFRNMVSQLNLRTAIIKNLPFTRAEDAELIVTRLKAAGVPD